MSILNLRIGITTVIHLNERKISIDRLILVDTYNNSANETIHFLHNRWILQTLKEKTKIASPQFIIAMLDLHRFSCKLHRSIAIDHCWLTLCSTNRAESRSVSPTSLRHSFQFPVDFDRATLTIVEIRERWETIGIPRFACTGHWIVPVQRAIVRLEAKQRRSTMRMRMKFNDELRILCEEVCERISDCHSAHPERIFAILPVIENDSDSKDRHCQVSTTIGRRHWLVWAWPWVSRPNWS